MFSVVCLVTFKKAITIALFSNQYDSNKFTTTDAAYEKGIGVPNLPK